MLVRRFIEGFQIIGKLEDSHVWLLEDAEPPESFDTLLRERTSLMQACGRRHDPEDEAFLWDSLQEEVTKGVADPPVDARTLDQKYGLGRWMPTPCFLHTQASGKRRRIDNAKRSGKNRMTSRSERFAMNSALTPRLG